MSDVILFNVPLPFYHNDNIIRAGSNNMATAVVWLQDCTYIYIYIFIYCSSERSVNNFAPYGTFTKGDIIYFKCLLQCFYVNKNIGFALRENEVRSRLFIYDLKWGRKPRKYHPVLSYFLRLHTSVSVRLSPAHWHTHTHTHNFSTTVVFVSNYYNNALWCLISIIGLPIVATFSALSNIIPSKSKI